MTLAEIAHGQEATIACLTTTGSEQMRLRELGLGEGRRVRVIANNDPLICMVGGCRIGLARRLASTIEVCGG